MNPILAALTGAFHYSRYFVRSAYDWFMFHGIVKIKGRIPIQNSFMAVRIQGPGLASNYYFQIKPDLALLALQLHMEKKVLEQYTIFINSKINEPEKALSALQAQLLGFFATTLDPSHRIPVQLSKQRWELEKLVQDALQQRQQKLILQGIVPNNAHIRQTQSDLEQTLRRGTLLVQEYYPKKIFRWMSKSQVREHWFSKELVENDWNGLTQSLLQEVFYVDILQPLEEADKSFKLEVQHVNIHEFATMLEKGEPRDDLSLLLPVPSRGTMAIADSLAPLVPFVSLSEWEAIRSPWTHSIPDALTVPFPKKVEKQEYSKLIFSKKVSEISE